ncbi:non-homologous end-joining DNA ligase [Nocardia sp. CDC160]|uniref:non-homologous end-joining DNA ligase n=1 Tax=Nocardia sp. CDC160 TaxID=3112166 RepID=UPI002DBE3EE1|nr:non-homologous end-joining DNA ligase [Nocardia sp. CDC160]MEC3918796.1 non-homologous end-joining DNA ligase [Nocardia sp. CDC160]
MAAPVRRGPSPMLATGGAPPDGPGWAVEMKWDGVRIIAVCEAGACTLLSRNGNDVSAAYPEVVGALKGLSGKGSLILDGEIIAADRDGAPSFGLLQRRMHVARPGEQLVAEVPVRFFVFDLLRVDGVDVMGETYLERRARLAEVALPPPISMPPYWIDVDASALLEVAREHRIEGIVSKRTDSVYLPGRRSPAWIKTPLRQNTEVVVAGWTPGAGAFGATFGSLVMGAHDETGQLVYIGNVGTGFTQAARRVLRGVLDEITVSASPFERPPPEAGAGGWHWVDPILVGDVEYREFSGERLRMPSWKGLRTDKPPALVEVPPRR